MARYGGEEFGFILLIRRLTAHCWWQNAFMTKCKARYRTSRLGSSELVTVSIGIISYIPTPNDEMESAVALADSALYQAKSDGRNQSNVHPSSIG
ncbi:diguanylate cyclase [Vibrio lentus]|nr:diguanylate cyclase [Vibrio lentus]